MGRGRRRRRRGRTKRRTHGLVSPVQCSRVYVLSNPPACVSAALAASSNSFRIFFSRFSAGVSLRAKQKGH